MQIITLARTGLEVSRMGMGGGGPSQLGQSTGSSAAESITVLQQALEAGVNFIDKSVKTWYWLRTQSFVKYECPL